MHRGGLTPSPSFDDAHFTLPTQPQRIDALTTPASDAQSATADKELPRAGAPQPPRALKHMFASWLRGKYALAASKQLHVTETVSLGEKRFVAILHAEGHKFLIGGGASGVSLLTQLRTNARNLPTLSPLH